MRMVDDAERRARLGRRQLLAGGGRPVEAVAGALVGLHATDPASVFLAARARVPGLATADVERALYDDRTLVRMLAMRRTLFVTPVELLPVLQAACTDEIAARLHRRLVAELGRSELGDGAEAWLDGVLADALAALEARGSATGTQLSSDVPDLRRKLVYGEGRTWGGEVSITTQALTILAARGHLVRGRPKGTLVSSQYEWAAADRWLTALPEPWAEARARAELVRRWLVAFGPATLDDVQWWTGWTKGATRAALAALGDEVVEIELDGGATGLLAATDAEPVEAPDPWVALLPALDPTPMGWKARDWYLGAHRARLFDRNGNIGPTAWSDG
ncbi:MAG: AlkZ family DNA glycosylase, partial [Acidimicrobiales bacterium]|nr:AlkZ family DNA glycosylase [Acidimicrobiales bacterium]